MNYELRIKVRFEVPFQFGEAVQVVAGEDEQEYDGQGDQHDDPFGELEELDQNGEHEIENDDKSDQRPNDNRQHVGAVLLHQVAV